MSAPIVPRGAPEGRLHFAIQQLAEGRSNAVGEFTLEANAVSTTVTAQNCAAGSTPLYTPTTAHAAAEIAAGGMYVDEVNNGG